jgi:site-specific recombinase XerD
VSEATWVFYKKTVVKFTAFLVSKADVEMTENTSADVLQFRNEGSKTLAAKTVKHDLKCLRMIFKAARQERIISEDPSEFVSATSLRSWTNQAITCVRIHEFCFWSPQRDFFSALLRASSS